MAIVVHATVFAVIVSMVLLNHVRGVIDIATAP
jgi:hypothetical protein